jgi:3-oxoacyl-[acyl-carrier-protein] synthase II
VCLMGFSSDVNFDKLLVELLPGIEKETAVASFKHVSGEYHTASAFAVWTATKLIEKQSLPKALAISDKTPKQIKHVLVLNQYLGINYSFTLLSQC